MKKMAIGLCLILTLPILAQISSVNLVTANPIVSAENPWMWWGFPAQPVTSKPTINMQSPLNNQVLNSNNIWLNFSIIKPSDWFQYSATGEDENGNHPYYILGKFTSLNYTTDDGQPHSLSINETDATLLPFPQRLFQFNTRLDLGSGVHIIQVSYEADCYYTTRVTYTAENRTSLNPPGIYPDKFSSVKMHGATDPVNFTIAPLIVDPQNAGYNTSSVPLTLIVDNSRSWVGYSLDGLNNVTVLGNTTLTGLSNGAHTITVYTNDSFGKLFSSQIVTFTVNTPTPTTNVTFIVAVAVVIGLSVGLLFFRRHRKNIKS